MKFLKGDWSYDGLAVITIDHLVSPKLGKNKIQFSGMTEGCETNRSTTKFFKDFIRGNHNEMLTDAATFVHNVEYQPHDNNYEGLRIFKADRLTMEEAKQIFEKEHGKNAVPFFFVHGFDNKPAGVMEGVMKAQKRFDDKDDENRCQIIPVLWPNNGGWVNRKSTYDKDRANAKEAAVEMELVLKDTMGPLNIFPNKNMMCHSMVNYVLRNAANAKIQFDNIFMVAAVSSFLE